MSYIDVKTIQFLISKTVHGEHVSFLTILNNQTIKQDIACF